MKSIKALFLTVVVVLLLGTGLSAEDMSGKMGLGFSVSEGSAAFGVKYWAGKSLTIEPQIAFARLSRDGNTSSEVIPGLGLSIYFGDSNKLRPYFGVRAAADMIMGGGETYMDIAVGPALGAEYFIDSHFSITGEYVVKFIFADDDFSATGMAGATIIESGQFLGINLYL